MNRLTLGVDLASLQMPLRKGLQEASRMSARGVQVQATGDLSPRKLSQTGRREFRHLLTTHNLECAALVCPFRHGLDVAEGLMERIDIVTQALALSFDLGARIVIVQAGRLPESEESPAARLLNESLLTLGRTGDARRHDAAPNRGNAGGRRHVRWQGGLDLPDSGYLINGLALESLRLRGSLDCRPETPTRSASAAAEVPVGHGDLGGCGCWRL